MNEFPPQLFVTGTDTNVGKSVISAMLTLGLKATYWKPIQSGTHPHTDTEWVKSVTALPETHFLPETYRLSQPLSPHLSAAIDGIKINMSKMELPSFSSSHLIIEGAGGLMVPLNSDSYVIDFIKHLNVPVLIVSRSTLGTINHTLLTLAQLRHYQIPIFGVIVNGPKNKNNCDAIAHFGQVKVIGEVDVLNEITPKTLLTEFCKNFRITK